MKAPLPTKDGLGPTRVRIPLDEPAETALELITRIVFTQRHRHPDDNEAAIAHRFANQEVVDASGNSLSPHSLVQPGCDIYFYRRPAPETPVPYNMPVLYEDERLIVVDKPPFLATMPRAQHIVETATVRLRRATGNNDLVSAHRLDRMTSGVLLFTKRPEFRAPYQKLFAARRVRKIYEAIAPFRPMSVPTSWSHHIYKVPGHYQAKLIDAPSNSLTHLTNIQVLSPEEQRVYSQMHHTGKTLARYTLHPVTGKTHQLRIHMFAAGVPILGDNAYPIPLDPSLEDMTRPMLLRARCIEFTDPIDGTHRYYECPRPEPLPKA